jgi:hypothetical protein
LFCNPLRKTLALDHIMLYMYALYSHHSPKVFMKFTPCLIRFSMMALLLSGGSFAAETVKGSLAATRGEVRINGAIAGTARPLPVKAGSILKTAANSGAIILPVPGQTVFIDQNTEVELKSCEMRAEANSAWYRHSAFKFKNGRLHCSIAHVKSGESHLDVLTPWAGISAHGTSWATWCDSHGLHVAVYGGTTTIHFGGADVDVQYGQVATITGEGDAAVLEILDLKTGRIVRYKKGGPGEPGLASAAEIRVARDLLEEGFGAFRGTGSEEDVLAFSQIVAAINKLLADNLLPAINPPFEWQLWPDWFRLAPAIQSVASPDKPLN